MLDYDLEAAHYDEERGGTPRAQAAAEAILRLAPHAGIYVDIAGGTGIVAAELNRRGHRVAVLDASHGMLLRAVARLPGRAAQSRAEALPLAAESVEVVTAIWLLHLLPNAEPVVAEVSRVLRPGGVFLSTVDKDAAHGRELAQPTDSSGRMRELAAAYGLSPSGQTTFAGRGQKRPDGLEPVFTLAAFSKPPKPPTPPVASSP